MDFAGHVSKCKPDSQGCGIGKGSIESFRRRLDPFRVSRAGCSVRICHGRLLSPSRREWSSIIIRAFPSVVNLKWDFNLTHYPTLQQPWDVRNKGLTISVVQLH